MLKILTVLLKVVGIDGSTSNGMYILVDDSDPFRIICYLESNNQKLKSVKLCLDYLKDLDKIKE